MNKGQKLSLISLAIILTSCYHYELGQRELIYRDGKTYPITAWRKVDSTNLPNGTVIHEVRYTRFKN